MKSKEEVDELFNMIKEIGGVIAKEFEIVFWGGYRCYLEILMVTIGK